MKKMCDPRITWHQSRRRRYVKLTLICVYLCLIDHPWSVEGARNKKKVLIIGEIPDEAGSFSSPSSSYSEGDGEGPRVRTRTRGGHGGGGEGSVFVPVAAYSVTHSRVAGNRDRGSTTVRRSRPVRKHYRIKPSASSPSRTTESAVYGYVQKPEIVEFRGQYFYGPNHIGSSSSGSSQRPHYTSASAPTGWSPVQRFSSPKQGGLGPGGLLLATLPLILAPMLSYLFTPMVIPVTATIAAGRRRRKRSNVGNVTEGSSMADIVFSGMNHLIGSREEQETVLLDGITSSSSSSARRKEKEINMRERNKIKQNRKGEKSSNFDPISYFDPKKKKNVLRRSDLVQERYHPHPVRCHSNRTTFENVLEPSQRNLP